MHEGNAKKPLMLSALNQFPVLHKVIIESLEQALYRLVVEVDGQQYYVLESENKSLTRHSIVEIQALLIPFKIEAMYLHHQSPYDEMIGNEVNAHGNAMLVPLGNYFADENHARHTKH